MPSKAHDRYQQQQSFSLQNVILAAVSLVAVLVLLMSVPRGASWQAGAELPSITLVAEGEPGTLEYSLFYASGTDGRKISPWHDIPLRPTGNEYGVYRFVCEIPKGSRPKFEINKEAPFNPIRQDTKNGKLREYPYDSTVNYGAFPQTWEDPFHREKGLDLGGDNDPLDVLELSSKVCSTGDVYDVKVIGALALVDGGEMDWKVITVRTDDALALKVDDVASAQLDDPTLQERLNDIRTWFRDYKIPAGKPANEFAFEGRYLARDVAVEIVETQNLLWDRLIRRVRSGDESMWWQAPLPAGAGLPRGAGK